MNKDQTFLKTIVDRVQEKSADEVHVYDVQSQGVVDYLVVVLASNTRKLNAIKDDLRKWFLQRNPENLHHIEGKADAGWVVVDAYQVAIHVLTFEAQEKYQFISWLDKQAKKYNFV